MSTETQSKPGGSNFTLVSLTVGHFLQHWLVNALLVLLPTVVASLGGGLAFYSILQFIRYISGGVITCLAGFIVDGPGNRWGVILTGCMILGAILFILLAITPVAGFLIIIAILLPIPGQVWHIPAIAAISQQYSSNRGFGLTVHGVGAQVGALVGPIVTGAIPIALGLWIGMELWRAISIVYIIPTLITAILVWLALKNLKSVVKSSAETNGLGYHLSNAKGLLSNPVILALIAIVFLRQTGFNALEAWVPYYLTADESEGGFGANALSQGIGLGIVTSLGFFMAPVLGFLSDKIGRKPILVPSMLIVGILSFLIMYMTSIVFLLLILGVIGLFSYTLGQLLQALVLDQVDTGIEGTTMGLVLGINQLLGSFSPLIAIWVSQTWGLSGVFGFASILWLAPAVVLFLTPVKKVNSN